MQTTKLSELAAKQFSDALISMKSPPESIRINLMSAKLLGSDIYLADIKFIRIDSGRDFIEINASHDQKTV